MANPSRHSSAFRSTSRRQRRLTVVALAVFSATALVTCRPPFPWQPGGGDEGTQTNASTCRTDLPDTVATLTIPSLGYSCPLYSGGQAMLDSGAATWINSWAAEPALASEPGGSGTIWIGGHQSSHGAPFAATPDLADEATITITDAEASATYRVVGRAYVEVSGGQVLDGAGVPTKAATRAAVFRDDLGADFVPRLVLQTSDGTRFRWMIYADLVPG
ncbi:MAG TPA: sortase [Ilumatobacteraceae bacterium]